VDSGLVQTLGDLVAGSDLGPHDLPHRSLLHGQEASQPYNAYLKSKPPAVSGVGARGCANTNAGQSAPAQRRWQPGGLVAEVRRQTPALLATLKERTDATRRRLSSPAIRAPRRKQRQLAEQEWVIRRWLRRLREP
jgi:hypothetical protein